MRNTRKSRIILGEPCLKAKRTNTTPTAHSVERLPGDAAGHVPGLSSIQSKPTTSRQHIRRQRPGSHEVADETQLGILGGTKQQYFPSFVHPVPKSDKKNLSKPLESSKNLIHHIKPKIWACVYIHEPSKRSCIQLQAGKEWKAEGGAVKQREKRIHWKHHHRKMQNEIPNAMTTKQPILNKPTRKQKPTNNLSVESQDTETHIVARIGDRLL